MIKTTIAMVMLATPAFADFTKSESFKKTHACILHSYVESLSSELNVTSERFVKNVSPDKFDSLVSLAEKQAAIMWTNKINGVGKYVLMAQLEDYDLKKATDECWGTI